MADRRSVKDYFRLQKKGEVEIDPASELSFVPSLDKEFLYLLGLEEVVQFRLELLDKFGYNVPKNRKGKGKKKNKKSPASAVEPCTPSKDPLICAQCSTDFSCSWEKGMNGSLICQACLKCSWRKEHWWTTTPGKSAIIPTSGKLDSHIASSSSQPVKNNADVQQEAARPFPSASSDDENGSDQKVLRMSPDNTSSSPLSSPTFFSDLSSSLPSSPSLDPLSPPIYYSSPFYTSPLSDGPLPPYYPSSSELNSSSSSLSPSPPHSSQYSRKKAGTPYWMDTTLAKSLLKDGNVKQETLEDKNRHSTWNSPLQSSENTEMTPTLLNLHNPQKTQVCNTGSVTIASATSTPVLSANKQKAKMEVPKLSLKKTTKEQPTSQIKLQKLKLNQSKLQKVSSDIPTLGVKQHHLQKTQVCKTCSIMMDTTTSTPTLSASKQEAGTEKVKPSLKKTTKEEHARRSVHPELKPNQSKLPNSSSDSPTLGLKQHKLQETQVCNTDSVMMASTISTPAHSASKQTAGTETVKPSLKTSTKEAHASQTVHEELKPNQGKMLKTFSILDKSQRSSSASSHCTKLNEHWSVIRPKETPIKLTFGNFSSPSPASSNQPVKKDHPSKRGVAFPSVNPSVSPSASCSATPGSSSGSSHSARSSQYLPKFSIHHTPSTQAATSKSFPDSGKECQQALWSRPRCGSECKPDPLIRSSSTNASTQQGKTSQHVVPEKTEVSLKNTTRKTMCKWIQGPEKSDVPCRSCPSMANVPTSSKSGCLESQRK